MYSERFFFNEFDDSPNVCSSSLSWNVFDEFEDNQPFRRVWFFGSFDFSFFFSFTIPMIFNIRILVLAARAHYVRILFMYKSFLVLWYLKTTRKAHVNKNVKVFVYQSLFFSSLPRRRNYDSKNTVKGRGGVEGWERKNISLFLERISADARK